MKAIKAKKINMKKISLIIKGIMLTTLAVGFMLPSTAFAAGEPSLEVHFTGGEYITPYYNSQNIQKILTNPKSYPKGFAKLKSSLENPSNVQVKTGDGNKMVPIIDYLEGEYSPEQLQSLKIKIFKPGNKKTVRQKPPQKKEEAKGGAPEDNPNVD
ncbi:MAG TPA: hypothetical protein VMW66_04000, partial [Elusimicrobiales bacterium]|nr:hypothetical protein [Elusimicrobiales bacterium]